MSEIYISSLMARQILAISRQALEAGIRKGKYISRKVPNPRGGRTGWKYEISLDSLPLDAQQRYFAAVKAEQAIADAKPKRGRPSKAALAAKAEAEALEPVQANDAYLTAPGWQQQSVDRRLWIVEQTMQLGRRAIGEWLAAHNEHISAATVYRWRAAYLRDGKNALMTGYGNRKGDSIIPDDVYEVFCSVYKTEGKVSVHGAYLAAIGYLREHYSAAKLPSVRAFEYRMTREESESAIYYARNGASARNRKFGRSISRDYSKISCGEAVFSDHMQLDLIVSLPGLRCACAYAYRGLRQLPLLRIFEVWLNETEKLRPAQARS